MSQIEWNDAYSVGVEEIDRQHKEFIRIINRLQWLMDNRYCREFLVRSESTSST
jgi:hemerythrin